MADAVVENTRVPPPPPCSPSPSPRRVVVDMTKKLTASMDGSEQHPSALSPLRGVAKKYEQEFSFPPSPRHGSAQSPTTIESSGHQDSSTSRMDNTEPTTAKHRSVTTADTMGEDDDEFHDITLAEAQTEIVTKSIFKEKKGFLTRLRGGSKYTPSDSGSHHAVLPAGVPEPPSQNDQEASSPTGFTEAETEMIHRAIDGTRENVEIVLEEEDPIDVSIEQATPPRQNEYSGGGSHAVSERDQLEKPRFDDEDTSRHDVAPQVVIHSTESDSDSAGFVTLNPVINRSRQGRRASSTSAMPPATTTSSSASSHPVILNLPIPEEASGSQQDKMVLTINALGATGLTKVEKFGTQSTLLEMRVCESTEDPVVTGVSSPQWSFLRTALHKKGGSEAQWNQQFTASLFSKTRQELHVAVRTNSKLLVGEAKIPLADVTKSLYDQHFTIYRLTSDGERETAGQVHLQLQITDAVVQQVPTISVIPTTLQAEHRPIPIPSALRNGALMFKVPYHSHALLGAGMTKRQWISVVGDESSRSITWCDPIDTTEKSRRLDVNLIIEIREGAHTKAFERLLQSEPSSVARESDRCFSVVSRTRTLDLVASSKDEAQIWIEGLRQLISGVTGHTSGTGSDFLASEPSARAINDFRTSAMSSREPLGQARTVSKKHQQAYWRNVVFEYARQNELETISSCLHDGCPIDLLETGTGDTLLMLACRVGNAKLVELCLVWRAKNDPHPEFGETALQVAVKANHASCLTLILSTAAKSDMDSEIVNHIDSNNDAPLHVASRNGDLACMQLLLHHGADVCVVEEYGRTPLHCAVISGSLDCVAYLLDVGGDSVLNAGDHDGDTALHYAALAGQEAIVKLLLESAANVSSTNIHGETSYDLASRENHVTCVKYIAQYSQTSVQETSSPATRNATASSLLQLHHHHKTGDDDQELEFDGATDGVDDVEDEEQDFHTYSEPGDSPVRRGPIAMSHERPHDVFYDDDGYYTSPTPSRRRPHHQQQHLQQPISPSARVRELLATHRERVSVARPSPVPPLHFHSARDDHHSRYSLTPSFDPSIRHAYTERMDRDSRQYDHYGHPLEYDNAPQYHHQRSYEHPLHHRRPIDPYLHGDDRGYMSSPHHTSRGRSMSALAAPGYHHQHQLGGYDEYGQWYDSSQGPQGYNSRRSNSADMSSHRQSGSAAWQHDCHQHPQYYHALPTNPAHVAAPVVAPPPPPPPPPPPVAAIVEDHYDTYYSDQGYAYYVNQRTGESQWENPCESTAVSPSSYSCVGVGAMVAPHPNPAAAVRIQLGQQHQNRVSASATEKWTEEPTTTAPSRSQEEPAASCESPNASSKYESRTGFKLSVDIASPPRQDESRPVFVPSPRARSPRKTPSDADAAANGVDSSFDKSSRPSSPRGKSKNVQLIELKRANNLALALSSFKIKSDRNHQQIVQAITSLDESIVNAELLVCLQRFFPTQEEAALLRGYTGQVKSLGMAEKFFFHLLQVRDVEQRIDCFLYKLQFARNFRSVHSKIQIVKRACKDLVENYSFVEVLEEFFKSRKTSSQPSFHTFQNGVSVFKKEYLPRMDEKLHSFQEDLRKASEIELLDVHQQITRLLTGMRSIEGFVDKKKKGAEDDRDEIAAHDSLQKFLAETRGKLADLEIEYEAFGQWEDKMLVLFGESKASCQLSPILECLCGVLDKEFGFIL